MKRFIAALFGVLAMLPATATHAAGAWIEGTHYVLLAPAQPTSVPGGKIEVMEVFSYACIACNGFQPVMDQLKRKLPPKAQLVLLPASFRPDEGWPMFQRAYFAAQSLGIAERTHQAMFDAVWKTGALAISDPATHRLRQPLPSIEDAANWYAHQTGGKPETFLAAARSFGVEVKMRTADAQVAAMRVPGTPCIIVNGRYRLILETLQGTDQIVDLVSYLVAKESGR